jgi:hypothetical protein
MTLHAGSKFHMCGYPAPKSTLRKHVVTVQCPECRMALGHPRPRSHLCPIPLGELFQNPFFRCHHTTLMLRGVTLVLRLLDLAQQQLMFKAGKLKSEEPSIPQYLTPSYWPHGSLRTGTPSPPPKLRIDTHTFPQSLPLIVTSETGTQLGRTRRYLATAIP